MLGSTVPNGNASFLGLLASVAGGNGSDINDVGLVTPGEREEAVVSGEVMDLLFLWYSAKSARLSARFVLMFS